MNRYYKIACTPWASTCSALRDGGFLGKLSQSAQNFRLNRSKYSLLYNDNENGMSGHLADLGTTLTTMFLVAGAVVIVILLITEYAKRLKTHVDT